MTFKSNWKVGLFIICALIVLGILVFTIGKPGSFLSSRDILKVYVGGAEGLNIGSDVRVNGLQAGVVLSIDFGDESGRVLVTFSVIKKALPLIKADSKVEVLSLGLLGDKYISISGGTRDSAQIDPSRLINDQLTSAKNVERAPTPQAVIENVHEISDQVKDILERINNSKALDQSLTSVRNTSEELENFLRELNKSNPNLNGSIKALESILKKIDRGEGTLGALVNDPTVYEQLKSLLGGVEKNKVLKYIIRSNIKSEEESKSSD